MTDGKNYKTDQERFWAGEFGDQYINRNQGAKLLASNLIFFSKILKAARGLHSCIEFGANIGMNLRAIRCLYPEMDMHGIEINRNAAKELANVITEPNVIQKSILEFVPERKWDLVLIKGVLIHINPSELEQVYRKLFDSVGSYLLVAEYYNPSPVTIPYRGHDDRLYKRDFAGEILDRYPDLILVDYGFEYHRDPSFPQDDITWFLIKKV